MNMGGVVLRGTINLMIITLLLVLGFATSVNFLSENSEGAGPPMITLSFVPGEEEQIADVIPGNSNTVTFPGTIEAQIPAGSDQDVFVYLNGSTELGWPVTINLSVIQVDPGSEAAFSATVTVPAKTSYYVQDTITVDGYALALPDNNTILVQPVTGSIRIAQYYNCEVNCSEPTKDLDNGDSTTLEIEIKNTGNGRDTFTIFIENEAELAESGIDLNLATYTIEIDELNVGKIQLNVKTSKNTPGGTYAIKISVKSELQEVLEGTTIPRICPVSIDIDNDSQSFMTKSLIVIIIISILFIILILLFVKRKRPPKVEVEYIPPSEAPSYYRRT